MPKFPKKPVLADRDREISKNSEKSAAAAKKVEKKTDHKGINKYLQINNYVFTLHFHEDKYFPDVTDADGNVTKGELECAGSDMTYTAAELWDRLKKKCDEFCFSQELCTTTARMHWQGRFSCDKRISLQQAKDLIGDNSVHLEGEKNYKRSNRYVRKDITHIAGPYDQHARPRKVAAESTLWQWEKDTLALVKEFIAAREARFIIWIYSLNEGGYGKSTFALWLMDYFHWAKLGGGSHDQVAFMLKHHGDRANCEAVIFNFANNTKQENVPYGLMEEIKDGHVLIVKYAGMDWRPDEQPQVICFANYPPKITGLKPDRWRIFELTTTDADQPISDSNTTMTERAWTDIIISQQNHITN